VRQKFVEVTKLYPSTDGVAAHVIQLIAKLSVIDEEIKNLNAEEKKVLRNQKSKPSL
jgi:hypothetical protein